MNTDRVLADIRNNKFIVLNYKKTTLFLYYNRFHVLIPLWAEVLKTLKDKFPKTTYSIELGNEKLLFEKIKQNQLTEMETAIEDINCIKTASDEYLALGYEIEMIQKMGTNIGVLYLPEGTTLLSRSPNKINTNAIAKYKLAIEGDYEVVRKSDFINATQGIAENYIGSTKPSKSSTSAAPNEAERTEKKESKTKATEVKTKTNSKPGIIRELLDCDKIRCNMPSYAEERLTDIRGGHWEVFEQLEKYSNGELIPRDPRKDIKESGVIGIDFGTKSTVVVKQDGSNEITPIRIGASSLSSNVKDSDFENPTIVSFMNIDNFLEKYSERSGRPFTSCEDIFVSYNALSDFKNCSTEDFYAYFSDLKQWSNNEKMDVAVRDKSKSDYHLAQKNSIEEKLLNPIEIYAYYIGLYINNMINGVFLRYIMSFPVKYSKKTKEFIRKSFENGIRKSLPKTVVDDEETMKKFSVEYHISEPAAYAVTALERAGCKPENENEKYLYGIFDFGGGTTDFDYGVWRGTSEEEFEDSNCDYVLECFGADSDEHLGGEKILEMLAYYVFANNKDMASEKKIVFALPYGESPFMGGEKLIDNSRSANRNLAMLKEAFRPLWEQHSDWESIYSSENEDGTQEGVYCAELQMYDSDGNAVPNCRFKFNANELIELIKERIRKGVDAFFRCMERPIAKCTAAQYASEKVHIFLAGNSSRSVFVQEIFREKMAEYTEEYNRIGKDLSTPELEHFELIPPPESNENGGKFEPNIKTGVAYGLVKSRPGGKIFVKKSYETDSGEETRFGFYLGIERREKFQCKLSPVAEQGSKTAYNIWYKLQGAKTGIARIYYTTKPGADVNELSIEDIPFREIRFEPADKQFVFIRALTPTSIEYTVADNEENIGETHILDII